MSVPTEPVLEVRCDQTGDWAEAESPAHAVFIGRTLCQDAWNAHPVHGYKPTATFLVNGEPVRARVPQAALWAVRLPSERSVH